jgi:hypothetical protein
MLIASGWKSVGNRGRRSLQQVVRLSQLLPTAIIGGISFFPGHKAQRYPAESPTAFKLGIDFR